MFADGKQPNKKEGRDDKIERNITKNNALIFRSSRQ